METSSNHEEDSFREYKMTLYSNNPNPACQIILPADYLSLGIVKPISKEHNLTDKTFNDSAKRKVLEQIGCDFIGITETPKRKPHKMKVSEGYCPIRERILNEQ